MRRPYATLLVLLTSWLQILVLLCLPAGTAAAAESRPPNFVIIFIDDMGYGDIGPFGGTKQKTPNLDRMAREGKKMTSFYATNLKVTTP